MLKKCIFYILICFLLIGCSSTPSSSMKRQLVGLRPQEFNSIDYTPVFEQVKKRINKFNSKKAEIHISEDRMNVLLDDGFIDKHTLSEYSLQLFFYSGHFCLVKDYDPAYEIYKTEKNKVYDLDHQDIDKVKVSGDGIEVKVNDHACKEFKDNISAYSICIERDGHYTFSIPYKEGDIFSTSDYDPSTNKILKILMEDELLKYRLNFESIDPITWQVDTHYKGSSNIYNVYVEYKKCQDDMKKIYDELNINQSYGSYGKYFCTRMEDDRFTDSLMPLCLPCDLSLNTKNEKGHSLYLNTIDYNELSFDMKDNMPVLDLSKYSKASLYDISLKALKEKDGIYLKVNDKNYYRADVDKPIKDGKLYFTKCIVDVKDKELLYKIIKSHLKYDLQGGTVTSMKYVGLFDENGLYIKSEE